MKSCLEQLHACENDYDKNNVVQIAQRIAPVIKGRLFVAQWVLATEPVAWDRGCRMTVRVALMVCCCCRLVCECWLCTAEQLGSVPGAAMSPLYFLYWSQPCISCPVLLSHLDPMMQQKWARYCWFIKTYPIIIYPSFRSVCREITDIAKFQMVNSCSSSQADNKSENILFPCRYQPMPLVSGKGERVPEQKTPGHCSWLLQSGSGCLAWRKEGGQDTVSLKRQPRSMSGIATWHAGRNYHEICLGIGSESMPDLIIFMVLGVGITWSKRVNDVMQAVGVAKYLSSIANWWS